MATTEILIFWSATDDWQKLIVPVQSSCNHISAGNTPREVVEVGGRFGTFVLCLSILMLLTPLAEVTP